MKRLLFAMSLIALAAGCTSSTSPALATRRFDAGDLARRLASAQRGMQIELGDVAGLDFVAETEETETEDGVTLWQGRIGSGKFWGSALAVVSDGEVIGTVHVDEHLYSIHTEGKELVVTEVDQSLFPEEAEPVSRPRPPGPRPGPGPHEPGAVTLRVLLVVPPQLSKWCTPSQKKVLAGLAEVNVDGVWAHFTGGAVDAEMSVFCTAHNPTTDLWTELEWVASDEEVKAQRAATRSNMVAFLVSEAGSCGQSYANYPVEDPGAATRAFSVVRFDCAWDNYSLPHELGHQLGMDHDRYTIKGGYLDRCNYGYIFLKGGKPVARDVMAYTGYCKSLGVECPRVGTYSVADTFAGTQLGVSCAHTGDTNPVTGSANNVEQLLHAAPIAATWH